MQWQSALGNLDAAGVECVATAGADIAWAFGYAIDPLTTLRGRR